VPVGAQCVRKDVGVEVVVLVASRPAPAAQVADLVRGDHIDGERRGYQRLDQRPVAAFDTNLGHSCARQHGDQLSDPGFRVWHRPPLPLDPVLIDDRDSVLTAGPVDPGGDRWTDGHIVLDSHGVPSLLVTQQVGTRWS